MNSRDQQEDLAVMGKESLADTRELGNFILFKFFISSTISQPP